MFVGNSFLGRGFSRNTILSCHGFIPIYIPFRYISLIVNSYSHPLCPLPWSASRACSDLHRSVSYHYSDTKATYLFQVHTFHRYATPIAYRWNVVRVQVAGGARENVRLIVSGTCIDAVELNTQATQQGSCNVNATPY